MRFILQITLADTASYVGAALPPSGLLSVFIGSDQSSRAVEHRVLYTPSTDAVTPQEPPSTVADRLGHDADGQQTLPGVRPARCCPLDAWWPPAPPGARKDTEVSAWMGQRDGRRCARDERRWA
jgi:hypothetical protein